MASTTSRSEATRRPLRAPSLILGRHAEALQRVGLLADAILPGDIDLQVRSAPSDCSWSSFRRFFPAPRAARECAWGSPRRCRALRVSTISGGKMSASWRRARAGRRGSASTPVLEPEAAAEDLHTGDDADPEDRERHGDLEEREPRGRPRRAREAPASRRRVLHTDRAEERIEMTP